MSVHGRLPATVNDCLRELGLDAEADHRAMKRRWRELTLIHHPDKGGDPELFNRVTHAYRFLTNPEYREKWERDETRKGNADFTSNLDMILTMPITFEDAFFGKTFVCTFNVRTLDENFKPKPLTDFQHIPTEIVTVVAPKGVFTETRVVFEGQGHQRGDLRGNAIALLRPQEHEKFKVEGLLITSVEKIPIDVMIRGGKITVLTMRGPKKVYIEPGTMPGDTYQIKGAGMDVSGQRLHHKVYVEPKYPTKEELKTKRSWKRFKIKWQKDAPKDTPSHPHGMAVYAPSVRKKP